MSSSSLFAQAILEISSGRETPRELEPPGQEITLMEICKKRGKGNDCKGRPGLVQLFNKLVISIKALLKENRILFSGDSKIQLWNFWILNTASELFMTCNRNYSLKRRNVFNLPTVVFYFCSRRFSVMKR